MANRKTYAQLRAEVEKRYPSGQTPGGVTVDDIVQLKMQNTYDTHLDIARDMAKVMREDMAAYDADASKFTQSLGCWSGFHAQQMIKAVKRMRGTARGTYVYLSGWMVAGLRNRFGHLPDQSMHEKTSVPALIEELYTFLRQADARELGMLFRALDAAREAGDEVKAHQLQAEIDHHQTHIVPIIADIDAGFGNAEATYLLAKKMIEAGDIGDRYNAFLDCEEIAPDAIGHGEVLITRDGKLMRPRRLPSNLYQFRSGTGEDRCVLDCITSLQHGADLLWIETEKPHIEQIASMVDRIREVVPHAKLVYNNSPSFNWTLNFRQQVYDRWQAEGRDLAAYDRARLMSADYDGTELAGEADERIRTFQRDAAARAGIFHHLITLPTYHTAALSTDNLAREYFGDQGMLGYVRNVQRAEIRQGIACVKHQNMAGSDIGDDHKEYFAGEAALKAGGKDNTMNQFAA